MNARLGFASSVIIAFIVLGTCGPLWLGPNTLSLDLPHDLASPFSGVGGLGRTENGISMIAYLLYGMRVSLVVTLFTTIFCISIGLLYGVTAAYAGGRVDAAMMRFIDILLAFPGILLAIYLASVLQPAISRVVIALCAMGWVGCARVIRAQTLSLRHREFIIAAKALGVGPLQILWRHVLPHLFGILIVETSFALSTNLLAEASLSFLGLGVPAGTPSLGSLLDQGVAYLFVAPHIAIISGLCIALCVLAFNMLGDELQDRLDLHMHGP